MIVSLFIYIHKALVWVVWVCTRPLGRQVGTGSFGKFGNPQGKPNSSKSWHWLICARHCSDLVTYIVSVVTPNNSVN